MAKGMKRSLADLNEYLFDALDKVTNDDLEGDELKKEIDRAGAVASIASTIVNSAKVQLSAIKVADDLGMKQPESMPLLLTGGSAE